MPVTLNKKSMGNPIDFLLSKIENKEKYSIKQKK